jgi:hypothetical protein
MGLVVEEDGMRRELDSLFSNSVISLVSKIWLQFFLARDSRVSCPES